MMTTPPVSMTTSSPVLPADPTVPLGPDEGRQHSRLPGGLWPLGSLVFRLTPKPLYRVRVLLLRSFGARIDTTVRIRPDVRIDRPWNLTMGRKSSLGDAVVVWAHAPIRIGARCTISQYCRLAAFQDNLHAPAGPTRSASLTIGDDVWIATETYVAGGQIIPDGVLIGARSVIDGRTGARLEPWTIASGDPAVSKRQRPFQGRRV
jgi:putative colanic acid biosynthesis acetyltransferase WcaF